MANKDHLNELAHIDKELDGGEAELGFDYSVVVPNIHSISRKQKMISQNFNLRNMQ